MLGLMSGCLGTGWSVSYRIPTWLVYLWLDVVFVTGEGMFVTGGVVFFKVFLRVRGCLVVGVFVEGRNGCVAPG